MGRAYYRYVTTPPRHSGFIARGDLNLSWGGTNETIRYIKVPDPTKSKIIEKTIVVEKPIITKIVVKEEAGVTSHFTIFKVVLDVYGSGIRVVTGHEYPNSYSESPESQYCYALSDKEGDKVNEQVSLANKYGNASPVILPLNDVQAHKLGISKIKANQLSEHCKFLDVGDPQPTVSDDTERPDKTIPKISASSGTGFAVNADGYFLTNAHVVKDCDIQGVFHAGKTQNLKIIAKDDKLDLAILKSNTVKIVDYLRFSSTLMTGQDIYAFGYPFLGELSEEIKVTNGIVSSLAGLRNNPTRIQITAAIQPGSSGGPVVDNKGLVIGVAVSGLVGEKVQNINFAIKKDDVLAYLARNRVTFEVASNAISQQTPDIVVKMKEAVFPIFCLKRN